MLSSCTFLITFPNRNINTSTPIAPKQRYISPIRLVPRPKALGSPSPNSNHVVKCVEENSRFGIPNTLSANDCPNGTTEKKLTLHVFP